LHRPESPIAIDRNAVVQAALSWAVPRGRIARGRFVVSFAILLGLGYVLVQGIDSTLGEAAGTVVVALLLWLATALSVRRLHDTGRSAWWMLVLAVPVLGALWLAWVLLVQRGTDGDNAFGPDPTQRAADYLTVS
jgi:uncharacterized membrane protein YhaH (DUF805 family)